MVNLSSLLHSRKNMRNARRWRGTGNDSIDRAVAAIKPCHERGILHVIVKGCRLVDGRFGNNFATGREVGEICHGKYRDVARDGETGRGGRFQEIADSIKAEHRLV